MRGVREEGREKHGTYRMIGEFWGVIAISDGSFLGSGGVAVEGSDLLAAVQDVALVYVKVRDGL